MQCTKAAFSTSAGVRIYLSWKSSYMKEEIQILHIRIWKVHLASVFSSAGSKLQRSLTTFCRSKSCKCFQLARSVFTWTPTAWLLPTCFTLGMVCSDSFQPHLAFYMEQKTLPVVSSDQSFLTYLLVGWEQNASTTSYCRLSTVLLLLAILHYFPTASH